MDAPTDEWAGFIEDFVKGQQDSRVSDIAQGIQSGKLKLLQLVEGLGPYLTSVEVYTRCRGTRLLAQTLHQLPLDFLSEKEVAVLVTFFLDRMKDHHSVVPHTLYGLMALSVFSHLPKDGPVRIANGIFKEIHVQSLAQGDRRSIYTILANFLNQRMADIQTMGSDFVYGYIQTMDGEKDPRNLVLAFTSVQIIAQHFSIGMFAEELFEVTACYFPIDFTPPPDDPHGIKRDDLIHGLRGCMSASPKFAEFCLPLLLEKMTSDVQSAKVDAMLTLAACAEVYGSESLKEFQGSMWSCIRRETIGAASEALESAALKALTAIVRTHSNTTQTSGQNELTTFLEDIFKELKRHLCDPDMRLVCPCGKLLHAAARGSDPACCKLLQLSMPVLLEQFDKQTQVLARKSILDVLLGFLQVARDYPGSVEVPNPMHPYKDSLMSVFVTLLDNIAPPLRNMAVPGLAGLLALPGVLSDAEPHLVATHLVQRVLHDSDSSVRQGAVSALAYLATLAPTVVLNTLLSPLQKTLSTEKMEVETAGAQTHTEKGQGQHVTSQFVLETMAAVSTHPDVIQRTVPSFLHHLHNLQQRTYSSDSLEDGQTTCRCLCDVIEASIDNKNNMDFFKDKVLSGCVTLLVRGVGTDRDPTVLTAGAIVDSIASVVRAIAQKLDDSVNTRNIVKCTVTAYLDGDFTDIIDSSLTSGKLLHSPLEVCSPQRYTQLISVLQAIVCSVPGKVAALEHPTLVDKLLCLATQSCHQPTSTAASQTLAGLINKMATGGELEKLLDKLKQMLTAGVAGGAGDGADTERHLVVWLWITKALVLRGHPSAGGFMDKMLELLDHPALGHTAAGGFYILLNEFPEVMSKAMNANVKLMYRQRVFVQTLPRLTQGFQTSMPGNKQYYLMALSYLLRFVPRQVLLSELPPLMPLLVQSLLCTEVSLQLSTMNTLYDLIHDAPQVLSTYVDTLLPQLLKLAQYKPAMKVRTAAVQCLGMLTTLPHHRLYPYIQQVTKTLGQVLDDHKRLVRQEAVQARNEWFLLGTKET